MKFPEVVQGEGRMVLECLRQELQGFPGLYPVRLYALRAMSTLRNMASKRSPNQRCLYRNDRSSHNMPLKSQHCEEGYDDIEPD